MPGSDACEQLEWDSRFFGRRIARISAGVLTPELLDAVEREAARERFECVYFLAEPDEPESLRLADASGFRRVDVRVALEVRIAQQTTVPEDGPSLRRAAATDASALRAIARVNHHDSRFYQDPGFPRERCDALYETWIDRSLEGWADVVLVTELAGAPVGYVTCSRRDDGEGQIGLFGVAPHARGARHGTRLIQAALDWFRAAGCTHATVVTQERNTVARQLYQRHGFATFRTQLWFHRWFEAPPR